MKSVEARDGKVIHAPTQRALTYGELAQAEEFLKTWQQPIPQNVEVTAAKDWKVLGKSYPRPNRRDLLTGAHKFPSDMVRPGKQLVWQEEFDRMMLHVHAWSKARQVAATYLAVVDRQIVIFVVPRGNRMDFELSDEIAALEVSLHHDFSNCRCEVRQIPGHTLEALGTFLDLEQAFILCGKPPTTSSAVGA